MRRLLSLAILAVAAIALAGDPLEDALRAIEEKGKTVRSFRARFKQEKTVYLLDEPLRSEGRILYARPGRLRWDTERPRPSTLLIDEKGMRIYLPELRQLEVYEFPGKEALGAILPLFGQSVEELRRLYDVSLKAGGDPALHTLVLVPRAERMRRAVARIEVGIEKETLLPRSLRVDDPAGDHSLTVFEKVEPDVEIPESELRLDVPEGTVVKKPLGGLPF